MREHLLRISERHAQKIRDAIPYGWSDDYVECRKDNNSYSFSTVNMLTSYALKITNIEDFAMFNALKFEEIVKLRNALNEAITIIERETFVQISIDAKNNSR